MQLSKSVYTGKTVWVIYSVFIDILGESIVVRLSKLSARMFRNQVNTYLLTLNFRLPGVNHFIQTQVFTKHPSFIFPIFLMILNDIVARDKDIFWVPTKSL